MNPKSPHLAINGGPKIRTKRWPYNKTCGLSELWACYKVIKSGLLSGFQGAYHCNPGFSFMGGPYVQKLEDEWSKFYGVNYSISVNSATSALVAALGALEIGPGDEVIIPAPTMTACAVAPLFYGAIPIFADVEKDYGTVSVETLEKVITEKTKVIMVVHLFGTPAKMDEIMELAKRKNIKVIEDCAQAHAAKYKNQYVGTFGDIGVFSLNVNKSIQVGEGGICTTNSKDLMTKMALIRNHGENVIDHMDSINQLNIVGMNFRMTEIQAAMATEQLKKVIPLLEKRLSLVEYLTNKLADIEGIHPYEGRPNCLNVYYQYPIWIDKQKLNITLDELIKLLNCEGGVFIRGLKPLYLQSIYQKKKAFKNGYPWSAAEGNHYDYSKTSCPNTEYMYENMILNEFVRPYQKKKDMDDIANIIQKVIMS